MRRLFIIVLMILPLFSYCKKEGDTTGLWVKNRELTFSKKGGEQIATLMYGFSESSGLWRIRGGRIASYVGEAWLWPGYKDEIGRISPISSDGDDSHPLDCIDGGWFRAIVPDLGQSVKLIVTVKENNTGLPKKACVSMQRGDYYPSIYVSQE